MRTPALAALLALVGCDLETTPNYRLETGPGLTPPPEVEVASPDEREEEAAPAPVLPGPTEVGEQEPPATELPEMLEPEIAGIDPNDIGGSGAGELVSDEYPPEEDPTPATEEENSPTPVTRAPEEPLADLIESDECKEMELAVGELGFLAEHDFREATSEENHFLFVADVGTASKGRTNRLVIEGFRAGIFWNGFRVGNYAIAGRQANPNVCDLCVRLHVDYDPDTGESAAVLAAKSGTFRIASTGDTLFIASLRDVTLREVEWDRFPDRGKYTQATANGCELDIPYVRLSIGLSELRRSDRDWQKPPLPGGQNDTVTDLPDEDY